MNYYLHDDPRLPLAWAPWFSHEYINYFCVQALYGLMNLPPTPVQPNTLKYGSTWAIGPRHVDIYKESYREIRQQDPLQSFDYEQRNGEFSTKPPQEKTIEPWKILIIYSTEPDLYLDCDLNVDTFQRITGGSHGWRHMQFYVCGMEFGVLVDSFRQHMTMAEEAMKSGNGYWGWRYLSRCTHYLADMGNPFHVKTAPKVVLFRKMLSFTELFRTISAAHQGYEVYVERRFREGFQPFKEALMKGACEGYSTAHDIKTEIPLYRQKSKKRQKPIFNFFLQEFGQELLDVFHKVNRKGNVDASKQINSCSENVGKVIFGKTPAHSLDYLDNITVEILFDVGKMLGMLLARFVPLQK